AYMETLDIKAKQLRTSDNIDRISLNEIIDGYHDNLLKFRHTNGQTAAEFGIINGEAAMIWYNDAGQKVWQAGEAGIVYVTVVPAKWTPFPLIHLGTTSLTDAQLANILQPMVRSVGNFWEINSSSGTLVTHHGYNAGK